MGKCVGGVEGGELVRGAVGRVVGGGKERCVGRGVEERMG